MVRIVGYLNVRTALGRLSFTSRQRPVPGQLAGLRMAVRAQPQSIRSHSS